MLIYIMLLLNQSNFFAFYIDGSQGIQLILILLISATLLLRHRRKIDVPTIIGLVLQIVAGVAFYFIGSYLFRLDSFLYLLDIVKSFIREKVGK